ncbi:Hypothetical_protein [Hexamita inflata]|uniref:Hypothetical_protein n=1 Tax=Hexamita inflata TaxID=28002 RepID=A0AA86Q5C9_9EUKA|nr:Hypothetical protein HINF_LOCUS37568 [Hexamita inflata]
MEQKCEMVLELNKMSQPRFLASSLHQWQFTSNLQQNILKQEYDNKQLVFNRQQDNSMTPSISKQDSLTSVLINQGLTRHIEVDEIRQLNQRKTRYQAKWRQ